MARRPRPIQTWRRTNERWPDGPSHCRTNQKALSLSVSTKEISNFIPNAAIKMKEKSHHARRIAQSPSDQSTTRSVASNTESRDRPRIRNGESAGTSRRVIPPAHRPASGTTQSRPPASLPKSCPCAVLPVRRNTRVQQRHDSGDPTHRDARPPTSFPPSSSSPPPPTSYLAHQTSPSRSITPPILPIPP